MLRNFIWEWHVCFAHSSSLHVGLGCLLLPLVTGVHFGIGNADLEAALAILRLVSLPWVQALLVQQLVSSSLVSSVSSPLFRAEQSPVPCPQYVPLSAHLADLFFFLLLFICAYKAWVISPPCPHPPPLPPTPPPPSPPYPLNTQQKLFCPYL
jgi:hypothetical protein